MGGLVGTDPELLTQVVSSTGEPLMMPDIRKLDILNQRMIVSRKRKRNLFDLTSQWKKLVLATLDKEVIENPREMVTSTASTSAAPLGVAHLSESMHRREQAVLGDMEYIDQGLFLVQGKNKLVDLDD